ncbi:MAG: SIS domain-containing protein [Planctomycetota bacterium]|nr:SIS domain-containing protein [Planctomycetota bacterium]MDI6787454.1 SIS domain-containing protein [Planctomycetota bacterium]
MINEITKLIVESAEIKYLMLSQATVIARICQIVIKALKRGNKIVLFGNGGSAADAQHIAAEIVGRFQNRTRKALPAIALTTNTSNLTAIANDFGFENVFTRQVEGLVNKGDVVIALSTSGSSPNVIKAVKSARQKGAYTIGFIGAGGDPLGQTRLPPRWARLATGGRRAGNKKSALRNNVHLCFCAPSANPARIQECHITTGHIICEMIDRSF